MSNTDSIPWFKHLRDLSNTKENLKGKHGLAKARLVVELAKEADYWYKQAKRKEGNDQ